MGDRLPLKCIVDTNVPKTANLAVDSSASIDSEEHAMCVISCVEAIQHVMKSGSFVIDSGDEIYDEYRKQLSLSGQPGIGDEFVKWVHVKRWSLSVEDRVLITQKGDSYDEFPNSEDLSDVDPSDRKFIAVANAHPEKPPILQATDSKWWGWQGAMHKLGLSVHFVCPDFIKQKYLKKMT